MNSVKILHAVRSGITAIAELLVKTSDQESSILCRWAWLADKGFSKNQNLAYIKRAIFYKKAFYAADYKIASLYWHHFDR